MGKGYFGIKNNADAYAMDIGVSIKSAGALGVPGNRRQIRRKMADFWACVSTIEVVVISGLQNHRQQWTARALGAGVLNELS
jgi:hypothetical protein